MYADEFIYLMSRLMQEKRAEELAGQQEEELAKVIQFPVKKREE